MEQEIVLWDFKMYPTTSGVTRLAGQSRVDTSLIIAKVEYPGKIENVILAIANNYPDALAGSVLEYKLKAPILVDKSLTNDQIAYLKASGITGATIIGGDGVVSQDIESQSLIALASF